MVLKNTSRLKFLPKQSDKQSNTADTVERERADMADVDRRTNTLICRHIYEQVGTEIFNLHKPNKYF